MFNKEPVLWLATINTAIALGVGFGLQLTTEQTALITAFANAVLALITRNQVSPVNR